MFNLLKSDVYRLVHGKMLWVVAGALVALSALAAGMMHWVSSPEFLHMTATSVEMTVGSADAPADETNAAAEAAAAAGATGRGISFDEALDAVGEDEEALAAEGGADGAAAASDDPWDLVADNPEALSEADFEEVSREMRTLASPADMLGDMAISGGELAMVVSLVVALFFAQDFSTHFARNLVMDRRGRLRYYGEKLVLVALLSAFFLAVASLSGALSFAVAGFSYAAGNPVGEFALSLALAWLLAFAYGCVTAVVVWASRSAGAGVAWALMVSSGIAGSLIGQVLTLAGRAVPWIGAVVPWLPASCMQSLGNQAAALLTAPAAAPLAMAPIAVQVFLVGAMMVALCAALTFGPLRKRDL